MISLATHRLAPEALQSIDNLATYLDCATKLVLTVFHLFLVLQIVVSSLVELTILEIYIWAARRSWQFHYGDHHLI